MPRVPIPPHLNGGPFTYRAGRDAGLGRGRLFSPDLARPYYGVRTLSDPVGVLARARAFRQRMPADAFFCSVTAAQLMRVPLPRALEAGAVLHVAVPAPRRALSARGVVGHKLQVRGEQIRIAHGLPVSSPELLWCELAPVLRLPDLVAVGDYLVSEPLPLTTIPALEWATGEHPGRRGKPNLRAALALLDGRSESPQESKVRVILELGGLTGFVPQFEVRTSSGHDYRIDLAFPHELLAVEYQGEHHRDQAQYRYDMTRRARLEADGWHVLLVNANDLHDATELVARIRLLLARRRS